MYGTISTRVLQPILNYARQRGLSAAAILAASGLDLAALLDGERRVSHEAFLATIEAAAKLSGEADFGTNIAESADIQTLASLPVATEYVVLQLLTTSATVREAIDAVIRAWPLSYGDSRLVFEQAPHAHVVRYLPDDPSTPGAVAEMLLGMHVRALRVVAARPFAATAVRFRHASAPTRAHERVFGVAPTFGADSDAVELPLEAAALPLATANAALHEKLQARAATALAALPSTRLLETVQHLITSELPNGNPAADRIAERLGISVRTLARRLAAEGTTHQALLDRVRANLAERYLLREGKSAAETARLVGFSEVSAFQRAFQRWNGCSPAARGCAR